jgi:hypothetical protein
LQPVVPARTTGCKPVPRTHSYIGTGAASPLPTGNGLSFLYAQGGAIEMK